METTLEAIGDVTGRCALILGRDGLEIMCSLLRRGVIEATAQRRSDGPTPRRVNLAVVSPLDHARQAPRLIAYARRALASGGWIIIRLAADRNLELNNATETALAVHGFSARRRRSARGCLLLYGEAPPLGLRPLPNVALAQTFRRRGLPPRASLDLLDATP
ncbi:MAG TPA: hypothetical protein VEI03_04725 [Stellaceae bacterium]|nr:hypothetical protein [Stellaceae bacterium]